MEEINIGRDLSKVIIALLFKQTLTGGFSCVNTRLAFDTEILLPNSNEKGDDVLVKDYNYKVCYRSNLDSDEKWTTRRVICKILKLHDSNQYGFAMTKPMLTGCIKNEP